MRLRDATVGQRVCCKSCLGLYLGNIASPINRTGSSGRYIRVKWEIFIPSPGLESKVSHFDFYYQYVEVHYLEPIASEEEEALLLLSKI